MIGVELAIDNLVNEVNLYLVAKALLGILLNGLQDLNRILLKLVDSECVRWVEWEGNH